MKQTHFKYGLITAVCMIIVSVILQLTNLALSHEFTWAKFIPYLVLFAGIILNANAFSNKNQNNVMFGQVFNSGFKVAAVVLLVNVIWGYLSMKFIFPDSKEKVLSYLFEQGLREGKSMQALEKQFGPVKENFMLFSLGGQSTLTLFCGALFSLIGAGIAKKKTIQTQE